MDFDAQDYIVTDAAPMRPVKEGQGLIDTMEEEKKVKSRAAVKKCREKKKREEEENMTRRERLRMENEDIVRRTAVYQQVNTSCTSFTI